jgi:hypothetical protein
MLNALVLICPFALSPDLRTQQTAVETINVSEAQSEFSCKLLAQIRANHVESHFESRGMYVKIACAHDTPDLEIAQSRKSKKE